MPEDYFDAALLVLSNPTSAPAIPPATSANQYLDLGGTGALIAGWGQTYDGDPLIPDLLQWAPTAVQDASYCGQFDPYFAASSELCAVNLPDFLTGTCYGDSGGPLAAFNASNHLVEIGITTHVPGDCDTYTADYFTNVIPISSWVAAGSKRWRPRRRPHHRHHQQRRHHHHRRLRLHPRPSPRSLLRSPR